MIYIPKGETNPYVNSSEPKPRTLPPVLRTQAVIHQEGLDSKEALKILELASPLPWRAEIKRVDDMQQPIRLDILDANGKLVTHFHQVVGSDVDTANWENNARFIINLVNIVEAIKPKENENVSSNPQS